MFFISKKDLNGIYDRLRHIESTQKVESEHDKHVLEKIKDISDAFKSHDEQEMIKYNTINHSIKVLSDRFYMVMGAFLLFQFLITNGYLKL